MRPKDDNKKQAIFTAALEVVTRSGLDQASMAKIAKKAGVSPATIYTYFDSKEDMLNKLYLMAKEESSREIFRDFTEEDDLRSGLSKYIKNLFATMVTHPLLFSFIEQTANSPGISNEVKEQGILYYAPLMNLYKRGLESGIVKDYPFVLLASFVYDPVVSLIKSHLAGEYTVDDGLLDLAIEMIWKSMT